MSLLLYIKIVFRQIKNCLWWLINYLKRLILFVFRRQNQQQQQQSNDDDQNENNLQYDRLNFVVIDKPLNDGDNNVNSSKNNNNNILSTTTIPSILNNPNEQQNSKFPNVQSYTEQDLYNYSNYSLTSIQSKQQQQNYSYDLNYSKNRSSSNSGEHQKQQQQQQEIADTVEEPDYFQDMVPEFKKPKTVYVNKHDHPMISNDNNQQNNYHNNDELNNKIEKKFRFKQQQQNQQQQDSSYQFNNNNNDLLSNEPNFTNQFGTIQLSSSTTTMDMNTNQITSWEDMANNDEELWIDTDQQLKTMRQQRREQRLNEHRRQKQLKHKNG